MALDWAAIGAGVIGGAASIIGGNKAADAMEESAGRQNALSERIYGQQRADQMPYMKSGYNALNAYNRIMGLPSINIDEATQFSGPGGMRAIPEQFRGKGILVDKDGNGYIQAVSGSNAGQLIPIGKKYPQYAQKTTGTASNTGGAVDSDRYGGFYESPGYQFRFDEGARAYDRSAASRGRLLSGAQAKAQTRYGQGVASEEFGNYANRLAAIAGLGQTGTQATSNAAGNYAANAGNAIQNQGMARASGYLNTANTIGSVANNVLASMPYWQRNNVPSQQPGYSAPGTGGFRPVMTGTPYYRG